MNNKNETKRFHGMKIISDQDCITVRGHYVLELNSSDNLVCRYYDEHGLEEDDPYEVNVFDFGEKPSESNITGGIKRQVGMRNMLISKSAVRFIKRLASN